MPAEAVTADLWQVCMYGSGTVNVEFRGTSNSREPWIWVGYKRGGSDGDRYYVAERIAEALNSGWKINIGRETETSGNYRGFEVRVIGPMVDADPPNLHWMEDKSWRVESARARLMDRLCGIGIDTMACDR